MPAPENAAPSPDDRQELLQAALSPNAPLFHDPDTESALYTTLFERSGTGKALLDAAGRVQIVNHSLSAMLGYAQSELPGASLLDWLDEGERPFMLTLLTQLESGRLESYQAEKTLLPREGQALYAQIHLVRLTDPDSGKPGLLLEAQDISRQQQETAAWEAARERLLLAEELAGVGYSSLDLATGHVFWSHEVYQLFGQTPGLFEPGLQNVLSQCVHPEDAQAMAHDIEQVTRTRIPIRARYRILLPNGEIRLAEHRLEILTDAEGKPAQLLGYAQNLTPFLLQADRLRQANLALEAQNQQLGRLAGLVDDELTSPLNGIRGLAEREDLPELVLSAHHSLASLDALSRDLQAARSFERVPLSLDLACQRAIQMLEPEIALRQVGFELDFSAWNRIDYASFVLESLFFHLIRSALLALPANRLLLRIRSAYESDAVQTLRFDIQGADLSAALEAPDSELSRLAALLASNGAELSIGFSRGLSQCLIRL